MSSVSGVSRGLAVQPQSVEQTPYFTDVKIQKIASYFFSATLTVGGAVLIGMILTGAMAWPFSFIAIPLFGLSFYLGQRAWGLKDYQNSTELEAMRREARYQSFTSIIINHGLENVLRYEIVSPENLREKFKHEYGNTPFSALIDAHSIRQMLAHGWMSLDELKQKFRTELATTYVTTFFNQFSLESLLACDIIDVRFFNRLSPLRNSAKAIVREQLQEETRVGLDFPNRQELLLKALDERSTAARSRAASLERQLEQGRLHEEIGKLPLRDFNDPKDFRNTYIERTIRRATDDQLSGQIRANLQLELTQIEAERTRVISQGLGLADQDAYRRGLEEIRNRFGAQLAELETRFRAEIAVQ